jgi:phosphohistidine phosphatase SixA
VFVEVKPPHHRSTLVVGHRPEVVEVDLELLAEHVRPVDEQPHALDICTDPRQPAHTTTSVLAHISVRHPDGNSGGSSSKQPEGDVRHAFRRLSRVDGCPPAGSTSTKPSY